MCGNDYWRILVLLSILSLHKFKNSIFIQTGIGLHCGVNPADAIRAFLQQLCCLLRGKSFFHFLHDQRYELGHFSLFNSILHKHLSEQGHINLLLYFP